MKKIVMLAITITCATLCWAPTTFAQEVSRPHITVMGNAKTEVVPDEMHWHVSVQNRGAELKGVSKAHADQVKEVLKLIRKHATSEKDIQTSGMRFGENYAYRNNSRVKEGYMATTNISFKMTDFDKYESLWLALSNFDEVNVNNVAYDYSKKIDAQNKTRVKALMAAKEKARTLAKAMALDVGETIVIEEEGSNTPVIMANRMAMAESADSGGSPVSPGTMTIEMSIKLVMGLINP